MPALAALIVVAGLVAYAPAFDGVFVLDDVRAVVRNPTLESLTAALSPPPESTVSGRPVANLSFAITHAMGSPESPAWSHHAGNLFIHLAAALVLFGVVRRTLLSDRLRAAFAASADAVAFAAALVWVVHPLNTESVTYIVQRVESLASLFILLTLYCAIRAADAGAPGLPSPLPVVSGSSFHESVSSPARRSAASPPRGPATAPPRASEGSGFSRTAWAAAAVVACVLGLGTKEIVAGAPLVVLAWDWLFRPARRPRWTLFAALAATGIVLALLVYREHRAPSIALGGEMVWRYLLTQAAVITHYLRLAFVATGLVFLYTWPLATSIGEVALPAVLVLSILALTIVGLVRRHPAAFAGVVFFIVLAPTSSVLPIVTEVAAEHRMYLPLAAIVVLVAALVQLAIGRVAGARGFAAAWGVAVIAVFVALPLEVGTRARNRVYGSDERLWADTVSKQPDNERARVAYGSVLAATRKVAEAEAQFRAAVALDAGDPVAQSRLGSALAAQGKFDEAIPPLERALALRPDDVEAHRSLGQIYALRQDDGRALPHLMRAAEAIEDPALVTRIAAILAGSPDPMVRDPGRALTYAERAVVLTGRRDPLALDILAVALAGVGRLPEAVATAREALPLATAQGNQALVTELEQRVRAYGGR